MKAKAISFAALVFASVASAEAQAPRPSASYIMVCAWENAADAMDDAAAALGARLRSDFEEAVSKADVSAAAAWYWMGVAFGPEGPPRWILHDSPNASLGLAQAWYMWGHWSTMDRRGYEVYPATMRRWQDVVRERAEAMRAMASAIRTDSPSDDETLHSAGCVEAVGGLPGGG